MVTGDVVGQYLVQDTLGLMVYVSAKSTTYYRGSYRLISINHDYSNDELLIVATVGVTRYRLSITAIGLVYLALIRPFPAT